MNNTPKPIHEVRIGHIKAAVWNNPTETVVRYNVTFNRIYKDGTGWRNIDSFGRDDLLLLGKVADLAHTWICERMRQDASAPRVSPALPGGE